MVISIEANSACSSCQVKNACHLSESASKDVEIESFEEIYEPGEPVKVFYKGSLGFLAVFLAYILPFILIIFVLISGRIAGLNDASSGILALGILIPYYFTLYFFKTKLKRKFTFSVGKMYEQLHKQ
jgi:sigma-E factor negative regulatory protein RseC